ncbi:MAG: Methylmalonyl-CoA carboxyltransferase 12S subunit [Elusimicrobia bacterium]|nr:Methylmalonyl-CoA carboxyltransferase 12S subunit [Elusimicrobiota bacterium]
MAIKEKFISELRSRRKQAVSGMEKKTEERRKKGLMTARDRVDGLFHAGSFQEFGLHAQHDCHNFGMESKSMPGDGVITGVGLVDGRSVASFSQDFMIGGGALGRVHAKKISELMTYAQQMGMPVVGFNDSGGARIQEGVESLSGYGQVFFRNVLLSGVVPQIAVIAGPCAGGAAYSPALMDFLIMVRKSANMFICGPDVIMAATGQKTTMEEIGSADAHASVSGNTHFTVDSDAQAISLVKKLLSFLPSNNVMDPPHRPTSTLDLKPDPGLSALVPEDPKSPMDVLKIIGRLVDAGDFLEVHQQWAKNIVIGFGRFQGVVAGVVANQPMVKAGTLDIDASDKAARFIRFCNAFNIPIVTLVDVPGFLPGVSQERGGIIRHGAKMLFAYAAATVPKITVIMRKAYGGAYLAMCSRDMGADMVFAWPCAEIAVMGAEGAVQILYKKDITSAADPKAKEAEYVAEYRSKFCTPYESAGRNLVTDVIEPAETRAIVSRALRYSMAKRETRPPKKHGTIPL